MNRITKFNITTAACLLAILCYALPFHDNALGGLVKPTITVMAKKSKVIPKTQNAMKFESKVIPKTQNAMKFESKVVPKKRN